jgi:uncharacterized membrane protein YdcZ (DUF606 family)
MSVNIFSYVIAVLAGSVSPVQAGASAQLNKVSRAALCVYASGLAGDQFGLMGFERHPLRPCAGWVRD